MPNWPDLVNGCLEIGGAAMLAANVRAVRRDKQLKGVHWAPTVFFTVWGLWNLYFYPSLDQWASFAGGLAMVLVNATWLGHVWYYWRNGRDDAPQQASPKCRRCSRVLKEIRGERPQVEGTTEVPPHG